VLISSLPISGGFIMKKLLVPCLCLALLLALTAGPAFAVKINTTAPDFSLPNLQGHKIQLSGFKGHIIILKLATTWCPTCRQQTQEILSVGKQLKADGVVLVQVFVQDSKEMVREAEKGKDFPMTHVALIDDGSALRAYNVYLIPRLLIIDQNFKVRRDGSLMTGDKILKAVRKLLHKS
jgi:peroxiredoxin